MANLKYFQNFPFSGGFRALTGGNGSLPIYGVYIPQNISFVSVLFAISASSAVNKTFTFRFGLYSLNGATLSLANSASGTLTNGGNTLQWVQLTATSATQDISIGNWYFAFQSVSGGNSRMSFLGRSFWTIASEFTNSTAKMVPGGVLVWGARSASSAGMPTSIATSDCYSNGAPALRQPYVIISG